MYLIVLFFEFSVLITNLRYTLILVGLIGMFDTFYYVTFTVTYATDTTHIESDDQIYLTSIRISTRSQMQARAELRPDQSRSKESLLR